MSKRRLRKKLIIAAKDCFKAIESSMVCYCRGETHMFKPIAGQLRILFCDITKKNDNSLLRRIDPDIRLAAFRQIEFQGSPLQVAPMPFSITKYANGVQIADIDVELPPRHLPLEEWREQNVTLHPMRLNVQQIIRTVANKGGGAHVDDEDGELLASMKRCGPAGLGANVFFIIALGRFAHSLGKQLIDKWEQQPASG